VIPSCNIIGPNLTYEDSKIIFTAHVNDSISDLPYIQYRWDFGDGNNTYWTLDNSIEHTYTIKGKFNVRCILRDDDWPIDENYAIFPISVLNVIPECWLEADTTADEDEDVFFYGWSNDTISDKKGILYHWDFDDGTTSGWLKQGYQNITHIYPKKGLYQARLVVRDDDLVQCEKIVNITINNVPPSCEGMDEDYFEITEDQSISFYGSGDDTKSDKPILLFSWDFGVPGIPKTPWSDTAEFEFTYTNEGDYTAVLTVMDDDFESDNISVRISVSNLKPIPKFLASESTVFEDDIIYFDATDSEDTPSDLPILNYTWDFDDDSAIKYGPIQDQKYEFAGDYRVILTVRDDNDETEILSLKIKVKNEKPKAVILISATEVYTHVPITFNGNSSTDSPSDMQYLSYHWAFDDGTTGEEPLTTHTYERAGKFRITLKVTDDDGSFGEATIEVKVIEYKDDIGPDQEQDDGSGSILAAVVANIIVIILLMLIIIIYLKGWPPTKTSDKKVETKSEDLAVSSQTPETGIGGQELEIKPPINNNLPPTT
jgi:PKD repeat protein